MSNNFFSKRKFEEIEEESKSSQSDHDSKSSAFQGSEQEEEEDLYEVEEIVGKKLCKGKLKYHVKWVGYPSSQNTWEPLENLTNVKYLIDKYEESKNTKKIGRKSKKVPVIEKTESIEDVVEKYKDFGLDAIISENKIPSTNPNRSRDVTNYSSSNDSLNLNFIPEEISERIKKNELIGDISRDKPSLIKYAKISSSKMQFLVKWEKRENGLEPFESFVAHDVIKELYPYVLIDFYETRLRCVNLNNSEQKLK